VVIILFNTETQRAQRQHREVRWDYLSEGAVSNQSVE